MGVSQPKADDAARTSMQLDNGGPWLCRSLCAVPDLDDPEHLPSLVDEVEETVRRDDELAIGTVGELGDAMAKARELGQACLRSFQVPQECRSNRWVDGAKLRDDLIEARFSALAVSKLHGYGRLYLARRRA